ncbi:hypothetical protein F4806DRAFT_495993 [Annulohypoxylon nitens]|nr:hypothetical protein F4806DRAFT_495993 [Annulohypoxylon nitens]
MRHVLDASNGNYMTSRVWPDSVGYVDLDVRVSETATLQSDEIVKRIESRALKLKGWRTDSFELQELEVQRYGFNGFYTFHYDWVGDLQEGNRMTTFMIYLVDQCTGGGTNFPRLEQPKDSRWCEIIECNNSTISNGDDEEEHYAGVTFKPIAGLTVYWENFHPNGTPHEGVRHAGLPVASGEKIGLNIFSWDSSWRAQGD